MPTRRQLLGAGLLGLLAATPSAATPSGPAAPAAHWLNHPRWCQLWWLARPETLTSTRWVDLIQHRVGALTSMGVPPSATSGARRVTTRPGGWGEVRCAGTGAHVLLASLFGSPPAITVALWVQQTAVDVDTNNSDVLSVGDNIVLRLEDFQWSGLYHYASGYRQLSSGPTLVGAGWRHLAYVVDPGQSAQVLYLDGVAVASAAQTDAIDYSAGSSTTLGKNPGNTAFDYTGAFDDVRVYSRALTAMEVRVLVTEGRQGYPGLLQDGGSRDSQLRVSAAWRRKGMLW